MAMAVDERDAVTLSLEGPRPQRRLTVAFRVILAIPLFVWAYLLSIPLGFVIIGIWVAALFTGRVPVSLGEFEARVLQFQARQYAYALYLMSDRWPTFALGPTDSPVELQIDDPPRMNRAAIFFRYFLIIPAGIVVGLVSFGLAPIIFVLWIIVLVSGRMPDSAHYALASVLRYQMRFVAYYGMLTSQYPRGIFGDKELPAAAPLGEPDLPAEPRLTRLVLSKASKRLIVLAMVLSVLSWVGLTIAGAITANSDSAQALEREHRKLEQAISTFTVDAQTCAASGDISCIRGANGRLIAALESFRRELATIDFPARALPDARELDDDVVEMIDLLRQLQETSDPATYAAIATSFGQAAQRFDDDYDRLYREVYFG